MTGKEVIAFVVGAFATWLVLRAYRPGGGSYPMQPDSGAGLNYSLPAQPGGFPPSCLSCGG